MEVCGIEACIEVYEAFRGDDIHCDRIALCTEYNRPDASELHERDCQYGHYAKRHKRRCAEGYKLRCPQIGYIVHDGGRQDSF
jgi:hypothetical protein